jgi:hypothetical protein
LRPQSGSGGVVAEIFPEQLRLMLAPLKRRGRAVSTPATLTMETVVPAVSLAWVTRLM